MRNALKWSAFVLLCVAVAGFTFAQTTGGGLQGKVIDENGEPIIGAIIQVTGPNLQGTQGTATDLNGEYRIPFLPVGKNYQVRVEVPNMGTQVRQGIEIPLGVTINLPFKMQGGSSEIVVVGATPIIDGRKTEAGAVISDTMINSIPLGRDSAGVAYLAPGAVSSGLGGAPAIGGASGPENSYIVNGMEVVGSGDGLNLTALNFDFIESTEVKTGGMDAEYGGLMGGAINSITKSGGNEFHGGLFAYYWSDSLSPAYRRLNNPTIINYAKAQKEYDFGGYVGGYMVKDKLWFFVAYDWNKIEREYSADGTDANVYLNGQPSYSWARATGYKNTYKDPQLALKLTWAITPDHKLGFSYFGDIYKSDTYRNLNNPAMTASPYYYEQKNNTLSVQWNATWTPKFFTELIIGTRRTKDDLHPKNAAAMNNWGFYYRRGSGTYAGYQVIPTDGVAPLSYASSRIDLASWSPSLGGRTFQTTKDYNDQVRFKGTNIFNAMGKHELSYGFQYFDITYDYEFNYTGPGVTSRATDLYDPSTGNYLGFNPWENVTSPGGAVVRWQWAGGGTYLYRAQYFMNDQAKKTSQKYLAYWAQDNWSLTDNFMLKIGLRLDTIHMKGGSNATNVPHNLAIATLGYDPYNLSTGVARKVNINDQWAPRVGFTWDPFKNGKSKLYGFYGWYYERIPNDLAIRALTDEYFMFDYFLDNTLTTTYDFAYTYGLHPTQVIGDPNGGKLKGSFNKETLVGFQYEVMPNLTMGVRAVYRELGRAIEDISLDGGLTYIVTNPDQWGGVYQYLPRTENGNTTYSWYTFPKPIRIYRALEVTVDKRFSNNWQMGGSYVLSRLKGNYEGLFSNDNGQLDPNITSKYDLPQLLKYAYGLLPNDRTHVLKLYGGYNFDWGLDLSANFTLQSGQPISKLGADDYYGINEGFTSPRGSNGRTPTTWALDLGVQYNIKLFKTNLGLRADIFNVTNEQRATAVDQTYNVVDVGDIQTYDYYKYETAHQFPRQIRLAVRWTF